RLIEVGGPEMATPPRRPNRAIRGGGTYGLLKWGAPKWPPPPPPPRSNPLYMNLHQSAPHETLSKLPMKVGIAGGGTGGHTSPGLAVAAALRASGVDCAWIGSRDGVEARRVPEAGLPFYAIPTGKLRRYWSWQNVGDLAVNVPAGLARAVT